MAADVLLTHEGTILRHSAGSIHDVLVAAGKSAQVGMLLVRRTNMRRYLLVSCGAVRCGAVRCGAVRCGALGALGAGAWCTFYVGWIELGEGIGAVEPENER